MNKTREVKSHWKILLVFSILIAGYATAAAQVWTVVGAKPKGTARDSSLAEAAQLSYRYDKQTDLLTFRVTLYGPPNEQAFGVNLAFDTGLDDANKVNWWGRNNTFKFDKLITAWVKRSVNGYEGTIGVGDANGVKTKRINNLLQNNLQIEVQGDSIVIAIKRTDLTDKWKMNLIAAVGSNENWNDDLPTTGFMTINLAAERPTRGLREIDLSRNNFELAPSSATISDHEQPLIKKTGRGKKNLILVPGMYSGAHSFDALIERYESQFTLYVVTPPGLNGTPPRRVPTSNVSFGERPWTRRLEQDILQLIREKKMNKPVIVAESHPASIAAMDIALEHPDKIGGLIIVGTNLSSSSASPKDPTRRTPANLQERVESVDAGWAPKWFKYVTPETWVSNDMPPEVLRTDATRGQEASQEIERAPLPVKIRYLCEFWAADVTKDLQNLQVPVLALVPGFDEKFLALPPYTSVKPVYQDSWDNLAKKNSKIQVVRIPEARLLVLADQPTKADEAIRLFLGPLYEGNR